MPYTSTNWSEVEVAQDILQIANANTSGFFWTGILYMLWFILMILFVPVAGFEGALLASGFIGMVIGIVLLYSSLISWQWFLPLPGIILFTILYIVWSSRTDTY